MYNSRHGTSFPPQPTSDQLALITIDYIRHRDPYIRGLEDALRQVPEEVFVRGM